MIIYTKWTHIYYTVHSRERERRKKDCAGGTQTYRVCLNVSGIETLKWFQLEPEVQKCSVWNLEYQLQSTRVPSGSPKECASRIALSCQHCSFWRGLLKGWHQNEKWIGRDSTSLPPCLSLALKIGAFGVVLWSQETLQKTPFEGWQQRINSKPPAIRSSTRSLFCTS